MNLLENLKLKWDLSLLSLIVTNLIVIVLAIVQKWDFPTLIYLYLAQSIIIGAFHFLKMWLIQNKNTSISNNNDKFTLSLILLIIVFSFFILVYYLMLPTLLFFSYCFSLFSPMETGFTCAASTPNINLYFYLGIVLFFINHLISFISNLEKTNKESITKMMFSPIIRIITIHFILIIGIFFVKSQVIVFLILKTIIDLFTHNYIHKPKLDTEKKVKENKNEKIDPKSIRNVLLGALFLFLGIFYGVFGVIAFIFLIVILQFTKKKNNND